MSSPPVHPGSPSMRTAEIAQPQIIDNSSPSAPKKISLKERMSSIGHKVLVLSGKGGVGKSTFTVQLALSLVAKGYRVGILDIDICGPSIPKLLGIETQNIYQCSEGWVPIYVSKDKLLSCMSIGFLLKSPDDAVVWRGPRKDAMIRQFLQDVYWGPLDMLIIDTPPGTSDEHITVSETLKSAGLDGSVIITTPQEVSLSDVRKEINFCKKLNVNILGVVENLSGFACPCCSEVTYIFSKGGGEKLSSKFQIPFLGSIPIDPLLSQNGDMGEADFLEKHKDRIAAKQLNSIVEKLIKEQLNLPIELNESERQIRIQTQNYVSSLVSETISLGSPQPYLTQQK